jgi:Ras-related protein Rab-1A
LLIGSSGVGKSSILSRYTMDIFNNYFITTIGVDFKFKNIQINNNDIKLQIWDTASQERFRCITKNYYKNSDIIIVCYDVTSSSSFAELDYWITDATSFSPNAQIALCGTKIDLEKFRIISKTEAENYANLKNLPYFEISSKTNEGINLMFDYCLTNLLSNDNFINSKTKNNSDTVITPDDMLITKSGKINLLEPEYKNTCCFLY